MASYVESSLTKGERVIYQGRISLWSLLPHIVIGFLLLTLLIGVLFWIVAAIRYFTTELAITNKRVIAKTGLISRTSIEINLSKIESVQVKQSIFGRIFNYGSILVSGGGYPQAPIPGISNPLIFRRAFLDMQEEAEQSKTIPASV
ncbi:PH domain-containing protein [Pseudomonas sp. OTU5201]|uniref:PH domain-containing protein n=1 Tax=Pseudomonas sp. OTU5201 TaxID=3043850 RepID=UPI00313B412D